AALGRDVDRRAVEGGRDLAGQERAVVVGVVPREPALVAGVLPERGHPLDGLDGLLVVEHALAGLVGLGGAEVPQQRIRPGRRVAERVAERLPDGMSLLLELDAEVAILLERLGRRAGPDLREPRLSIRDEQARDAPGQ